MMSGGNALRALNSNPFELTQDIQQDAVGPEQVGDYPDIASIRGGQERSKMSGFSGVTSLVSRAGPPQPYLGGNRNKHRAFAKAETYGVRIRKSNLPAAVIMSGQKQQ